MPPKTPTDETGAFLWFLLKHSEFKPSMVNWDAVAASLNIKKGAAQTRWYRLQKVLESSALSSAPGAAVTLATPAAKSAKGTKRKAAEASDDEEEWDEKPKSKKQAKGKGKGGGKKAEAEVEKVEDEDEEKKVETEVKEEEASGNELEV